MTDGTELMVAWSIVSRVMVECKSLVQEVAKSLSKAAMLSNEDWGYKGRPYHACWNFGKFYDGFKALKIFTCLFKLREVRAEGTHQWYCIHLIFDPDLIEKMHDQMEPLIFASQIQASDEWQEETEFDTVVEFNVFDEYDRNENEIHFEHGKFPKADGQGYKYQEEEGKNFFNGNYIGYPLVSITNSQDIEKKLIQPLFLKAG